MSAPTLKVGDVVWVRPGSARTEGYEAVVSRIGRVWVTLRDTDPRGREIGRFRMSSWWAANGCWSLPYSTAVYPSRAVYEASKERREAWGRLRNVVTRPLDCPDHLTTDDIRRAIAILSLKEAA